MNWTTHDIPQQNGRFVVITGATGGIGFQAARELAGKGANVMLTGRNQAKGDAALRTIAAEHPHAQIQFRHLDLASLASVRAFAEAFYREHPSLDLLINNAGVMVPPERFLTEDGFELQFGTNYLGHFALTHHLLPALRAGKQPHVVTVSSGAHRLQAAIHFDDLQWERRYRAWPAYAQSKLATLLFGMELQRRSDANGWGLISNGCHPGYARTDLQTSGRNLGNTGKTGKFGAWLEPLLSQSAADGALPTLFAATSPDAKKAGYYGPQNMFELKGPVGEASVSKQARDPALAARLWQVSEQLTGARWPSAAVAA